MKSGIDGFVAHLDLLGGKLLFARRIDTNRRAEGE